MSQINNSGLDQYGAEAFEQQQFGTGGAEGVNSISNMQVTNIKSRPEPTFIRHTETSKIPCCVKLHKNLISSIHFIPPSPPLDNIRVIVIVWR